MSNSNDKIDVNILDNLLEGFQIISFDWEYIYVNKTVATQGKKHKEDLIGRKMWDVYPGIEKTDMFKRLQRSMTERVYDFMENEFIFPDGSIGWFELRVTPVVDGIFIISFDITERKRIENKLKESNYNLKEQIEQSANEIDNLNRENLENLIHSTKILENKLPHLFDIYANLPNSFVLHKSKEISNGVFFYYHKKKDSIILAAAECKNKSLYGVMLSILCLDKLNNFTRSNDSTSEILNHLFTELSNSLISSKNVNEGLLDIAICTIDVEKKTIEYCGVNKPMWLINKNQSQIVEINTKNNFVNVQKKSDSNLSTQLIQLSEGDRFYIFANGIDNQFHSDNSTKLTLDSLKKLLAEIQYMSMRQQNEYLNDILEENMGGNVLKEDLLLIGVQI